MLLREAILVPHCLSPLRITVEQGEAYLWLHSLPRPACFQRCFLLFQCAEGRFADLQGPFDGSKGQSGSEAIYWI
jgi:hypothetical protein